MNTRTLNVHELRQHGYKVGVMHHRWAFHPNVVPSSIHMEKTLREHHIPLENKGGFCLVTITDPEGRESQGKYNCNPNKNYNRHIAMTAALGRAWVKLHGRLEVKL